MVMHFMKFYVARVACVFRGSRMKSQPSPNEIRFAVEALFHNFMAMGVGSVRNEVTKVVLEVETERG